MLSTLLRSNGLQSQLMSQFAPSTGVLYDKYRARNSPERSGGTDEIADVEASAGRGGGDARKRGRTSAGLSD
jgi:hypothetical protein